MKRICVHRSKDSVSVRAPSRWSPKFGRRDAHLNPFQNQRLLGKSKYFVGRRRKDGVCKRICNTLLNGGSVMLIGLRQVGKTKVLERIADEILPESEELYPIIFDFKSDASLTAKTVVHQFCRTVIKRLRQSVDDVVEFEGYSRLVAELENFQRVQKRRPVVFIDEFWQFEKYEDAEDFLNKLTALCDQGVSIVISSFKSQKMFSQRVDELFAQLKIRVEEVFVEPFDRSEFVEFCDLSSCSLKAIENDLWELTHGHPHLAKNLIHEILSQEVQDCNRAYAQKKNLFMSYFETLFADLSNVATGERTWWRQICDYYLAKVPLEKTAFQALQGFGFFKESRPCRMLMDFIKMKAESVGSQIKKDVREKDRAYPVGKNGLDVPTKVKYGKRFEMSSFGELTDTNDYGDDCSHVYKFTPNTDPYLAVIKYLERYDAYSRSRAGVPWRSVEKKDNSDFQRDDARKFRDEQMMAFSCLNEDRKRVPGRMIIPDDYVEHAFANPDQASKRGINKVMGAAEDSFLNDSKWSGCEIRRTGKRKSAG